MNATAAARFLLLFCLLPLALAAAELPGPGAAAAWLLERANTLGSSASSGSSDSSSERSSKSLSPSELLQLSGPAPSWWPAGSDAVRPVCD